MVAPATTPPPLAEGEDRDRDPTVGDPDLIAEVGILIFARVGPVAGMSGPAVRLTERLGRMGTAAAKKIEKKSGGGGRRGEIFYTGRDESLEPAVALSVCAAETAAQY